MSSLLRILPLIFLLLVSFTDASAQSPSNTGQNASDPPRYPTGNNTTTVNAPGTGSQNGISVINGNYNGDYPEYAGSSGSVKLRKIPGDLGNSEIKGENGFKGKITGLKQGSKAIISVNSKCDIEGNGGSVTLGSGSQATVTNTGGVGSTNITVYQSGGGSTQVPPGSTAIVIG